MVKDTGKGGRGHGLGWRVKANGGKGTSGARERWSAGKEGCEEWTESFERQVWRKLERWKEWKILEWRRTKRRMIEGGEKEERNKRR